ALDSAALRSRADVARTYGELFRRVDEQARKRGSQPAAAPIPEEAARRQVEAILGDHESPAYFSPSQTYYYMSRGEKDGYGKMLVELDRMAVQTPEAWPRAMVLGDSAEPYDPRIFVRGNPAVAGRHVPRQFLRILAGPDRRP